MRVKGNLIVSGDVLGANVPAQFYPGITVKHSDDTQSFRGITLLSVDVDDFYLNQNNPNTDEVNLNLRGTTEGALTAVTFTDGVNSHDDDTLNVSADDFYLSTNLSGEPVLNLFHSEHVKFKLRSVISADIAEITFSLPTSIAHTLDIDVIGVSSSSGRTANLLVRFNGDSGSNYETYRVFTTDSLAATHVHDDPVSGETGTPKSTEHILSTNQYAAQTSLFGGQIPATDATAGSLGHWTIKISEYRGTSANKVMVFNGFGNFGNAQSATEKGVIGLGGGQWLDSSAITSITFLLGSSKVFTSGTVITITGI